MVIVVRNLCWKWLMVNLVKSDSLWLLPWMVQTATFVRLISGWWMTLGTQTLVIENLLTMVMFSLRCMRSTIARVKWLCTARRRGRFVLVKGWVRTVLQGLEGLIFMKGRLVRLCIETVLCVVRGRVLGMTVISCLCISGLSISVVPLTVEDTTMNLLCLSSRQLAVLLTPRTPRLTNRLGNCRWTRCIVCVVTNRVTEGV